MLDIVTAVLLMFVNVTDFAELVVPTFCLANVRLLADRVTCCTPAPVRDISCGLFEALSLIVRVSLREPSTEGVNVTLITHLPLPGIEVEQVSVSV